MSLTRLGLRRTITPIVTNRLFPASGPSSKALNNDLNMQALLPKAGHNTIVPLANRKPEHFCDLTLCDSRQRRGVRCFNCNQFGHYARSCPWDTQCGLCFGWGHRQDQCANNHVFKGPTNCQSLPTTSTVSPTSSYSLNFNGVPQ